MPAPRDFRSFGFSPVRIERCGKYLGRYSYWKLYAIENTLRVVLHSVLLRQILPPDDWWNVAVDPKVREKAGRVRADYTKRPWHTPAGSHDVYYIFLPDISRIMRTASHLFEPVIPDIDNWIARIDDLRLPRNLVGHMNFPNRDDRQRIDALHRDVGNLISAISNYGLSILVP